MGHQFAKSQKWVGHANLYFNKFHNQIYETTLNKTVEHNSMLLPPLNLRPPLYFMSSP